MTMVAFKPGDLVTSIYTHEIAAITSKPHKHIIDVDLKTPNFELQYLKKGDLAIVVDDQDGQALIITNTGVVGYTWHVNLQLITTL